MSDSVRRLQAMAAGDMPVAIPHQTVLSLLMTGPRTQQQIATELHLTGDTDYHALGRLLAHLEYNGSVAWQLDGTYAATAICCTRASQADRDLLERIATALELIAHAIGE